MDNKKIKSTLPKQFCEIKKQASNCESCEFYDYDEEIDSYVCMMSLDEDEMLDFIGKSTGSCPYYRYYDEYKSVRKQN